MNKSFFVVAVAAVVGCAVGIALHAVSASDFAEPMMNQWGVFSMTSLGACVGCLIADEKSVRG